MRKSHNQVLHSAQDTKSRTERINEWETIFKALSKLHVDGYQASRNITKTLCRGQQENNKGNKKDKSNIGTTLERTVINYRGGERNDVSAKFCQ